MLRLQNATKVFRTRVVETRALNSISIDVNAGEFVTVTGPSGSGKSTLLNVVGLLETLDDGQYTFDGLNVSQLSDNARSELRNVKIGFVFQSFHLIPDLTALENVALPLHYRGLIRRQQRSMAAAALERVGLSSRAQHVPAELSGGQQQRVAIARALVGGPRLILADEPTGNLDREMTHGVLTLLRSINADGTAVILVTHDPELAVASERSIHLVDGAVVANGPVGNSPVTRPERQ
jgi:putative ABC transport system ATP-binding protein